MVTKRIRLKDAMVGLQAQMDAKLTLSRRTLSHPGAVGDVAELEWISLLNEYLPHRYSVDKGFVVDHEGSVSDQIDILIYDRQYTPFVLHVNGVKYIPAEAIYASIECKQDINKKHLEYASAKAKSVRKLERTSLAIVHAGGKFPGKRPHNIICGLLCVSGGFNDRMGKIMANFPDRSCLNFVCSLSGAYARIDNFELWTKNPDQFRVSFRMTPLSLVTFVLNLTADLQAIGTVPAIDIRKYLAGL